jgi:hypothetical protein
MQKPIASMLMVAWTAICSFGGEVLVEAESFDDHGGWVLDTQFIHIMGSPYLMAHGLGKPVADATTEVHFPESGTYRVFVRTKDWVARWQTPGQPGRFQLLVNGQSLDETFGTQSADWHWHDGGTVEIAERRVTLALRDLTGFNGRADAIYFTKDLAGSPPPNGTVLPSWRRRLLGLSNEPEPAGHFDFVVVGGGHAGTAAAVAAARMGVRVALIQNRPVLGGNGSSEIRVWAMGHTRLGPFPEIGGIVEEFADRATLSPGTAEEFGDDKKEAVVRAEPNVALLLNHHAFQVEMDGPRIVAVQAFDTRSGAIRRFTGSYFADCTGHGTIGAMAGADYEMAETEHLGMSNMWRWKMADSPQPFPDIEWALNLEMADFPYPRQFHGQWFWESGFDHHPVDELERTRDWNLRAVFGAFNAMKNRDGAVEHQNAMLEWIAYVGGTRESRRLLGDVILTGQQIRDQVPFDDGVVPTTWSIDLHYPDERYLAKYPDDPYIARAVHGPGVDRRRGYPVPYRCFYSRNIENLFMAGRNVSVDREGLGTIRVMRTGGMMGEVVGKAVSILVKHGGPPRDVYHEHLDELKDLLRLPHPARRETVHAAIVIDQEKIMPPPERGWVEPRQLPGIIIDDRQSERTGTWTEGQGLRGFVADGYHYSREPLASARFEFQVPKPGRYEVRAAHQPHENRATNTPVAVHHAQGVSTRRVNQREPADQPLGFLSLGIYHFEANQPYAVVYGTEGADGLVHIDAVQVLAVD